MKTLSLSRQTISCENTDTCYVEIYQIKPTNAGVDGCKARPKYFGNALRTKSCGMGTHIEGLMTWCCEQCMGGNGKHIRRYSIEWCSKGQLNCRPTIILWECCVLERRM